MEIFSNIAKTPLPGQNHASEHQFSLMAKQVTELSGQSGQADRIIEHPAEKYGILEAEDKSAAAPILDMSEQQIIDMMFSTKEIDRPSLYGQRRVKPANIGNFIDLRGWHED